MKVYYHPVSTTSRMIMLFAAEEGVDLEFQVVDLFTGEHLKDAYAAINPNRLVPVLEDGDFRLTESSAILKYLADKVGSPAYPEGSAEARAGQRADGLAQQQPVPRLRLRADLSADLPAPQPGRRAAVRHPGVGKGQDQGLADRSSTRTSSVPATPICAATRSPSPTISARPMLSLGEVIGCNYAPYPNVTRWLGNMKTLKSWPKVNEVFYGLVNSVKDKPFQAL